MDFFYPDDTLLHNMGIFCRLVAINDPVSYTHLDVYKRQADIMRLFKEANVVQRNAINYYFSRRNQMCIRDRGISWRNWLHIR